MRIILFSIYAVKYEYGKSVIQHIQRHLHGNNLDSRKMPDHFFVIQNHFLTGKKWVSVGSCCAGWDDHRESVFKRGLRAGVDAVLRLHAADQHALDSAPGKILAKSRILKRAWILLVEDVLRRGRL